MKNINKKGFTFVELIVVVTILTILGTLGFSSYIGSLSDTRDSQRKSDLTQVSSALKIYKQKRGYYPFPGNYFNITYNGTTVAYQGKLNKNVRLNSLDKLPNDPETKGSYMYSIANNKQEFELASVLENSENNISFTVGNYKSVSINILPTILLATGAIAGSNIEIKSGSTDGDQNRKLFIYNSQSENLAYTFKEPYNPYSSGIGFQDLLNYVETNDYYWQNTDFRNCIEIQEGGKALVPFTTTAVEYQIITDTGALINTGCTL